MENHVYLFPRNTKEYSVKDIYMLAGRTWVLPDDWSYPMKPCPDECARSVGVMKLEWKYRLRQRETLKERLTTLRGHIPNIKSDLIDRSTASSLHSALNMAREENNRMQIRVNRFTLFNELTHLSKCDIINYASSDPNYISDYEMDRENLETDVWQRKCKIRNEKLMLRNHQKLVRRKFKHGGDEATQFTITDDISLPRCRQIMQLQKEELQDLLLPFYEVSYLTSWENVQTADSTVEDCLRSIASLKEHIVFGRLIYARRCMKSIVHRHFEDLSIDCKEGH